MSWFKRKNRDATQIKVVLDELDRLGARMGVLKMMGSEGDVVMRAYPALQTIIDSATDMKTSLSNTHAAVKRGRVDADDISDEIEVLSTNVASYHDFLDLVDKPQPDDQKAFIPSPAVRSLF